MRAVRLVALLTCASAVASARAATPTATEFTAGITPGSTPQSIAAGPDGNMWFTELASPGRIGRITPSGTVTEFTGGVAPGFSVDSGPLQIAAGPDGNMWFTENALARIGRITPSGAVHEFSSGISPSPGLQGIAAGPDGNMWFAESTTSKIGRITTGGTVTEYSTPTPNAEPVGITPGPDGTMYFGEAGIGKLGSITTGATPTITEFIASDSSGQDPRQVALGLDDQIWFTDFNTSLVGTASAGGGGTFHGLPSDTQPSGITSGPDGALWFAETGRDAIGRVAPNGNPTEVTSGITSGAEPFGIATGPDGNLWFAEFGRGAIGRMTTTLDAPLFTAPAQIDVPVSGTQGPASPYPATIGVSGLQGTVTRVRVRLNGVFMQRTRDLDALLVGPQGQSVVLISEPEPPNGADLNADGVVMTFADGGDTLEGPLVSGVFAPRAFLGDPNFPAPAPPAPHGSGLSTFAGTDPNGTWQLYVNDPASLDTGEIAGGWSLDLDTTGPPPVNTTTVTTTTPGPTVTVTAPPDTTPATLRLANVPRRLKLASFLKGFKIRITPDEPAAISVELTGTTGEATLAAVRVSLFDRSFGVGSGTRIVTVKPARAAVGKPRKAFKVRLRIVATDRGGNVTPVDRTITVTPAKKKTRKRTG